MKPLDIVYWSRIGFGAVAALVSILTVEVREGASPLVSGISVAILVYIITYYLVKWRFMTVVEKPSKLFMMGIGAYFMTWIVVWGLLHTLIFH